MLTYVRQGYYTDPKTRLRYHNAEVYQIVKSFVCVEVPFADLHTFQQAPGAVSYTHLTLPTKRIV